MVTRNTDRVPVLHVFDKPLRHWNTEPIIKSKLIIGEVYCVCGKIRKWRSGKDDSYLFDL